MNALDSRHVQPLPAGPRSARRCWVLIGLLILISLAFHATLTQMLHFALGGSLYSHILLVPFITLYVIHVRRHQCCTSPVRTDIWLAVIPALLALTGILLHDRLAPPAGTLRPQDALALGMGAFVAAVWAAVILVYGRHRCRALMFPLFFLIFLIPMPTAIESGFEHLLLVGTAAVLPGMLTLSGTSYMQEGFLFALPGLNIEVAPECSGIRSSFVLFITSLLGANLLLRSTWRRVVLACLFYPLGILRNAFRIFTLTMLTLHVDPNAMDSALHHRGGPIFFVISLVPFFGILAWFMLSEKRLKTKNASAALREGSQR